MNLSDFDYDLPPDRIAHYPLEKRSSSRLMVLGRESGKISHQHFYDLVDLVSSGDLLVFNDSRVIPARLLGHKQTGGKVEVLIERILAPDQVLAHVKASHIKPGHFAYVTLHVGAGTFQPVKVENIHDHVMHSELIYLPQATVDAIQATKARGGRVISVGTTATRTLESVGKMGPLHEYLGETDIFIYPGFEFTVIDAMITNFHLPKSSLLMLVAAFAGYDLMRKAYDLAVQEHYRFFSYGDAMLITS